jgi:hypothetical protein
MARVISTSDNITLRQARRLWRAKEFAATAGLPLNYALSLHLHAFVDDGRDDHADDGLAAFRLLQQFLNQARRWLKRKKCPLAAIWVREAEGSPKEHVHLALHLPPDLVAAFREMIPQWIPTTHPQASLLTPIRPPKGVNGWLAYMVKGGNGLVRAEYSVPKKYSHDQGIILGKRTGITEAINSKAQKRLKYQTPLAVAAETGNTLPYLLGRPRRAA